MTGAATSHQAGADLDPERRRLAEARERAAPWRQWGPYLSDRQWGTVREDYSPYGTAWDSFPHDHARSRAYRWGEDGLLASATTRVFCASTSPSGMKPIPSSKSDSLGWLAGGEPWGGREGVLLLFG